MESRKKVEQLSLVSHPEKVKILILGEQKSTYSDFYFLTKFTSIIKLDLSFNKISVFPVGFSFKTFTHLKTLFLHYNKFSNLKSLQPISDSNSVEYLTLFGNPLEEAKTRHLCVNQMLNLKMLDEKIVNMDQRNSQIISLTSSKQITITYPIVTVLESEGSEAFLSAVIQELITIRTKYIEANKIIKIQRWFRKIIKKKQISKRIIKTNVPLPDRLQTDPVDRQQKRVLKNRLITQKLVISKSNEQKIASIFKMNLEFFATLKQRANQNLYAERQYCEKNKIQYQEIGRSYICLRKGNFENLGNRSFLQLILKISQGYLIRSKGQQISSELPKKYNIFKKFLSKKGNTKQNQKATQKIHKIQQNYETQLVKIIEPSEVKFHLIKQSYLKIKSNSSPQQVRQYFPFCLQQSFDRTVAAVGIQRLWRGYRVRKIWNTYKKLNAKFSAIKIQRWIRSLGIHHRSSFYLEIRANLKKDNSKTIIIQSQEIIKLQKKYQNNRKGVNLILSDQSFKFEISKQSNYFDISLSQTNDYPMIIPEYMNDLIKFSTLQKDNDGIKSDIQSLLSHQNKKTTSNILDILFFRVQSINYWKKNSPTPIVSFTYNTVQQARTRKFLLGLVSYSFLNKKFITSLDVNTPNTTTNVHKVISEITFVASQNKVQQFPRKWEIENRKLSSMKIKLFLDQKDLSAKFIFYIPQQFHLEDYKSKRVPKKNLKDIASTIAANKSIIASASLLQTQIDRCNNYKVGLQINGGNMRNQILQFDHSQNQKTTHKGHKNIQNHISLYQSSKKSLKGQQWGQQNYRKSLSKIQLQQNNQNKSQDEKISLGYRYQPLQTNRHHDDQSGWDSVRQRHSFFKKQKLLQKSKSLRPNKNIQGLSLDIENTLKKQENTRKNINTELIPVGAEVYKNQRYFESIGSKNHQNSLQYSYKQKQSLYLNNQDDLHQLRRKKIKYLKESHRLKLQENSRKKQGYLTKIKRQMQEQTQKNQTIVSNNKLVMKQENTEKHNRIRAIFQNKQLSARYHSVKNKDDRNMSSLNYEDSRNYKMKINQQKLIMQSIGADSMNGNSSRNQFQSQFVKKGNKSMRLQLLKYEKNRQYQAISLQATKSIVKKMLSKGNSSQILNDSSVTTVLKKKPEVFKTQIKQFSVDFDRQSLPGEFSLGNINFIYKNSREQSPKQKGLKNNAKQGSVTERKQSKNKNYLCYSPKSNHQDVNFNEQQQQNKKEMIQQPKKKRNKLKKIVHSVFPQQFYPLKQTKKLGFQLPNISKSKQY